MSWSHHVKGPALEVAREVEKEGEQVQKYLTNPGEKALHARAVALIVVACHEGKEHDVQVAAYGHFDGVHNHISITVDGIDAEVLPPIDDPIQPDETTPVDLTAPVAKKAKK